MGELHLPYRDDPQPKAESSAPTGMSERELRDERIRQLFVSKKLSRAEMDVAFEVIKGITNNQVASILFVTDKTVKYHLTNIFKKLQVKSRAALIVMCVEASK